ncbi:MAG: Ig-like domain repeat protein, partial [Acidimicrobiales bacterium]
IASVVSMVGLASPAFALGTSQGGNGATLRGVVTISESAPGGGSSGGCGGAHTSISVTNAAGQGVFYASNNGGGLSAQWTTENVPNGAYTITSNWDGTARHWWGGCYTRNVSSARISVSVANVATISYSGPTSAPWGTTISASASLVDPNLANSPLADQPVTFTLSGEQPVSATTNASGVASVQLSVDAPVRSATLSVSFGGSPYYAPTSTSVGFTVQGHPTRLAYSGPSSATWGASTTLRATLTDAVSGVPVSGDPVVFSLAGQSASGVTDAAGVATATLTPNQEPGNYVLVVSFAGDADYAPSTTSAPFRVRWPYSFVDSSGQGTVKINPATKQFLFEAPSANPTQVSGPVTDPTMTVLALPTADHVIDITSTSPSLLIQGHFIEETGQFAAVADTPSHLYTLSALGAAS